MMHLRSAQMVVPAALALALIGGERRACSSYLSAKSPDEATATADEVSPWLLTDPAAVVTPPASPAATRPVRPQPILTGPMTGQSPGSAAGHDADESRIPEPTSLVLLLTGVVGLVARRRLRRDLNAANQAG
jgi:hypothetical protein